MVAGNPRMYQRLLCANSLLHIRVEQLAQQVVQFFVGRDRSGGSPFLGGYLFIVGIQPRDGANLGTGAERKFVCDHDIEQHAHGKTVGYHGIVGLHAFNRLGRFVFQRATEIGAQNHSSLGVQTASGVTKVTQLGQFTAEKNVVSLDVPVCNA